MESKTSAPIVKEVLLEASPERVWRALTNREEMKEWYFDIKQFRPEPGFEFSFYGEKDGEKFLHICRIMEVMPQRKISYTWGYEGKEGESLVSFELFPEGNKTRLRLTHEGV